MGCGTMKMCVCANATDAADYLEKLAAVPELQACRHEPYQGRCVHCDVAFVNGAPVSGCGTTNGPGGRAPASGSGGDDAGPTPAAPPTNPSASAGSTPAGSASLSARQTTEDLVTLAVAALKEAEAILGGEYGDTYAILCDKMLKLESALSATGRSE